MTIAAKLLEATHVAGGRLWVTGDGRLGVRAPRRLVDLLRDHKAEVLALLTATVADRVGGGETVVIGPWFPNTGEEVAVHRRRVLEEQPRRWWWMPRYRLAELERGGLSRAEAVQVVREEVAGRDTVPALVEDRRQVERTSGTDSQ